MRKFLTVSSFLFCLYLLFFSVTVYGQTTTGIREFVLFGGQQSVQMSTSTSVSAGAVGSYKLVKSTGNSVFGGNIHSGGRIELANSNTVNGNITAANSDALPGTILQVGSNAVLNGKIDVNGNIVIGGGTVVGPRNLFKWLFLFRSKF